MFYDGTRNGFLLTLCTEFLLSRPGVMRLSCFFIAVLVKNIVFRNVEARHRHKNGLQIGVCVCVFLTWIRNKYIISA